MFVFIASRWFEREPDLEPIGVLVGDMATFEEDVHPRPNSLGAISRECA